MKTGQALYEAIEAVTRLHGAMIDDRKSPDIKPDGSAWIDVKFRLVNAICERLDDMEGFAE